MFISFFRCFGLFSPGGGGIIHDVNSESTCMNRVKELFGHLKILTNAVESMIEGKQHCVALLLVVLENDN